jgi:trimethylamine--corrinoid protein Co-methyltransferase
MIVDAAFRVLERTGCLVQHEGALKLLKNAGCRTDGNRVWIPAWLIQKALVTAPKQAVVYDREGKPALNLSARSGEAHFVAGLENQYRIDIDTGEKRPTVKEDVRNVGKVIQESPNIDVACGLASINDCTEALADAYELRMLLETTTKPILVWNFSESSFRTQIELCAAVAGGMDKFLEKPFILAGGASSPPLSHSQEALGKMLYMFELGLPSPYIAGTMMGATAPVSIAGALVTGLADIFTGLVLSQVKNEGTPFFPAMFVDMFDMRAAMLAMSSPEFSLGGAAVSDLMRYVNLPFAVHLGCTDSPVFDQQAAFDIGTQLYTGLLSGANLNFFAGYLETAMSSSIETLLFCDEAIGYYKYIVSGVEVTPETLAEDVIDKVGPAGDYLGQKHTREHFKDHWMPSSIARTSYENWQAAGAKDLKSRYSDKAREIIAKEPEKPLAPELLAELDGILEKAEAALK